MSGRGIPPPVRWAPSERAEARSVGAAEAVVSAEGAAALVGVAVQTIRRWTHQGRLVPCRSRPLGFALGEVQRARGWMDGLRDDRRRRGR